MTVQYQGNGIYNCYIGDKILILSEVELLELQEIEFNGGKIEKLRDKIDDFKCRSCIFADDLDVIIYEIEKNVDNDIFDNDKFKDELSKISKIITQMQDF